MNGISLFPLTVIFKGKNTFIQNVHIMVLFPKYKRKNPFMTKVGLQVMVIYCVASSSLELEKLRKDIREKKRLSWNFIFQFFKSF